MGRIEELLAQREDGRSHDEIKKAAEATIHEVVSAIFDEAPVNIIAVEGHLPHFNDGDPCIYGIESQVEWMGYSYYSPIGERTEEDEIDEKYKALLLPEPDYKVRESDPNYAILKKGHDLVATLADEFEALDDYNGTWWMFIRDANEEKGYRMETGEFDHD